MIITQNTRQAHSFKISASYHPLLLKASYSMNILFDLNGVFFDTTQQKTTSTVRPLHPATMYQLLEDCKAQGHRLFVISNWSSEIIELISYDSYNKRLFSYFDDLILADKVGLKKPDPRIFDHIITKHNLDPQLCVFIDDQIKNLEGAQKAGIQKNILCDNFNFDAVRQALVNYGAL